MTIQSLFTKLKKDSGRLAWSGPNSIAQFVRLQLLKTFGFPDLFLRLPQTIGRLFLMLCGTYPFRVYAFTSFDLWLRSYYSKLVRNFREAGRWGYVWDESLGFPMGPRFGSNRVTYAVYGALSPRQFSLASCLLFFLAALFLGVHSSNPWWHTFILILMLIASPALIFSLVAYTVKPEVIWWWMALPMIFFAFQNQWASVWIFLSILLLVNTSVAVLMGAVCGGLWLTFLVRGQTSIDPAMLWLLPGVLVRGWRFLSAYIDGNLGATVSEQSRMTVPRKSRVFDLRIWMHQFADLSWNILIPCMVSSWPQWSNGLILGLLLAGLWFVSRTWFKVADTVTLNLMVACAVIAMASVSEHWINLIGVFLVLMKKPFMYLHQIRNEAVEPAHSMQAEAERLAGMAGKYPWFSPFPFPAPEALMRLLGRIPSGSRLVLEGDGNPREQGRFIRFHDWTYEIFPDRQIEFINHTFLNRMLEPDLAERYLNNLTPGILPAEEIERICFNLGVSHLLAFSEESINALQRVGYQSIASIRSEEFSELADLLMIPGTSLTLLSGPRPASIISPKVTVRYGRNRISWDAEAGETYFVRYRYYPQFKAFQGNKQLPVSPYHPFDDLPLTFMSVQADQTGLLELAYGRLSVQ